MQSLTIRIDSELKQQLQALADSMDRSLSYVAIEALKQYSRIYQAHYDALKADLQKGIDSLEAGKGIEADDAFFDAVIERARQRLKQR